MAEPTFKRDKAAEEAAIAAGIATKEQIESRGGINTSGYYGDSYREGITLTDEEYAKAIRDAKTSGATGGAIGAAVNTASGIKAYNYYLSKGMTPQQAEMESGYTSTGSVSTLKKPTGDIVTSGSSSATGYNSGTGLYTASDGKTFSNADAYVAYQANLDKGTSDRKSAYDLLYSQFAQYGLGSLVEPLKGLIVEGVSPSEFTLRLRETDAYKKRFAANTTRINQGLRALSEAEYIQLEDQYQDVMRRYGMPASYYARGDMGIQPGFEKFIGFDVSPVELEDRIQTAQSRVFDANPEVAQTLKQFYPGITNGDILAYVLDPKSALPELKRKITAAEIGAGAKIAGLSTGLERATELASYGVTKEQAQQGFQTIADILPRGSQLSSIYGEPAYTQTTAEQEVFGLAGSTEAAKQRKKLTSLEQAAFSGTSGMTGGALGRERAGQF
jgi:hypothetical protein